MNIEVIDVKKAEIVQKLCDLSHRYDIVNRLIVFGSAANKTCTETSDLDICFDVACGTRDMRAYNLAVDANKICDYNCDIVFYSILGNQLKSEIDQKGVVVYES